MEIERKFLIKQLPDNLCEYPKQTMEQCYINLEPEVRVRKSNGQYFLTIKEGKGIQRIEVEKPINASEIWN